MLGFMPDTETTLETVPDSALTLRYGSYVFYTVERGGLMGVLRPKHSGFLRNALSTCSALNKMFS